MATLTQIQSPTRSLHFDWESLVPPGRLGAYILTVGLTGLILLGYGISSMPWDEPLVPACLFVLIFALEWAPIKLVGTPLQGSNLSVSAAVAFAALLVLGPAGSILTNTGSALAYWLKEERPFYKRCLTSGTLLCSSAGAGLVYFLAGGQSPIVLDRGNVLAAGLGAAVYFLINSSLISGAVSLQTKRPFHTVLANWQWLFMQMLATMAIGLVMAAAFQSGYGLAGFALAALLLILPWYSIYFYVQKSRQVDEQNARLKEANTELAQANRVLDLRLNSLRALHRIGISLNSAESLHQILEQILKSVVSLIGADTCAIFLEDEGKRLTIAGHVGLSDQYVAAPEMALDGSALRALRESRLLIVDGDNHLSARMSAVAAREGIRAAASIPLNVAGEMVGGLDVCFKSKHTFSEDEISVLKTLAEQAAVALHNARLVEQVQESYLSTIRALAAAVEAKDPYTRGHSEEVRRLAVATGRQLGLASRQLELLNLGALFHDIGKIGISESILHKDGELTDEEACEMRRHTTIGESILSKIPALDDVRPIVRHHHERFDGTGYPDGICASASLLAAVISVCDTYQAMTSDRPYRHALTHHQAIQEIQVGSGSQFVPEVVEAFVAALEGAAAQPPVANWIDPVLACPGAQAAHLVAEG